MHSKGMREINEPDEQQLTAGAVAGLVDLTSDSAPGAEAMREGAALLRESLEKSVRTLGERHLDVAITRLNLGTLVRNKGELDEAKKLTGLAVAGIEQASRKRGEYDPLLAQIHDGLVELEASNPELAEMHDELRALSHRESPRISQRESASGSAKGSACVRETQPSARPRIVPPPSGHYFRPLGSSASIAPQRNAESVSQSIGHFIGM